LSRGNSNSNSRNSNNSGGYSGLNNNMELVKKVKNKVSGSSPSRGSEQGNGHGPSWKQLFFV